MTDEWNMDATEPFAEARGSAAPIPCKCPVCDGSGLVSRPPYVAGDQREWSSSSCGSWPCKSCGGSGLLWAVPPNVKLCDMAADNPKDTNAKSDSQ